MHAPSLPLLLALTSPPTADEATVRWEAPPTCPEETEVIADIESIAGVGIEDVEGLQAEATVRPTDTGWTLDLVISTASGSKARVLQSPQCAELAETAATLVAVAIGSTRAPEPEPEPLSDPEPDSRWRAIAGASFGGGLGVLPGFAAVVSLRAGAQARWAAIEATSSVWLPQTRSIGGAEGTLHAWSAGVRGCGLPRVGEVSFPLCLGLDAGQLRGQGRGAPVSRDGALPWIAVRPELAVLVPLNPHVGVRTGFSLIAPLVRPGFEFQGIGLLHRVAPIGGMLGAGLDVNFP